MKNKKGFTLTEILLAVMIVGIIGVALAALTTAASRESGVGRSKVLLRNNLSIAMRQLREDIHHASRVMYVRGEIPSASAGQQIPLLVLAKNLNRDNEAVLSGVTPTYVTYCFSVGSTAALPEGSLSEGYISRLETTSAPSWNSITPSCPGGNVFLYNVKYIPPRSTNNYPVPLFRLEGTSAVYSEKDTGNSLLEDDLGSVLRINLITERPSTPIVNDVVEEIFVLPNGFRVD